MAFEASNPPAHLPRFVQHADMDYKAAQEEWRTYYSYGRRYEEHPNGVVGTSAIRIAVDDIKTTSKEFQKMGLTELESNDSIARYQLIRNQEIHLISSQSAGDELFNFLSKRGSGVFAIRFEVKNLDSTYAFLKERLPAKALVMKEVPKRLTVLKEFANGVQLEFVEESEEQGAMAQQLRPDDDLDSTSMVYAAGLYDKYCSLCHGKNREGYAADHAPSLSSHSLLGTSKTSNFMRYTIQFGAKIYAKNCTACHGEKGEGISAPALGNPMLLATATDHFLRYAIAEGRDGTPMAAFKDSLSNKEIDAVTAFLRSRVSGWNIPQQDTVSIPLPENYVLNPKNKAPKFNLREGRYVSAEQLFKAMKDSLRIVLDARSEVAWRQTHIPGSIQFPIMKNQKTLLRISQMTARKLSFIVHVLMRHLKKWSTI